jgi:cobyrinic acid a,c-diamide synthase
VSESPASPLCVAQTQRLRDVRSRVQAESVTNTPATTLPPASGNGSIDHGVVEVAAAAGRGTEEETEPVPTRRVAPHVRIGVAWDAAFCFYYHEYAPSPGHIDDSSW